MNRVTAELIINKLTKSLSLMNELLFEVNAELSDEEKAIIKRAIARMMNACDSEITDLIIKQYPDLRPF